MELHQRIVSAPVDFGAIRSEFGLASAYPAEATAEARDAIDAFAGDRVDRTDIPFVTIDPPGALDLDQALYLERTPTGFIVHYAIADVGAVITPDGALAEESGARGQTFYLPDNSVPLHPPVLAEGSASLLPGQTRPVALWTIELDEQAEPRSFSVVRALVRSRARLDYTGVQDDAAAGRLHPSIAALPEFGTRRIEAGLMRGAIGLRLPAQTVVRDECADGHWRLVVEPRTPADDWNEQVSLLTGICAARIMLDSGARAEQRVALLRTMPPPAESAIDSIRRTAHALGVTWPAREPVGRMLARLDLNTPAALVLMSEATSLLRGASYTVVDGAAGEPPAPEAVRHSGIGAPYAHVTAPLRRLSDRFATEICLARCAGNEVPRWVRDGLTSTADAMRRSDGVAGKLERACIDLTEATLLTQRVGAEFDAVVVREGNGNRPAEIFIADPPVLGSCVGEPPEGAAVRVRLTSADPRGRKVTFAFPA
ncbi:RNB domain-containing ribonuclease [Nocardia sp. NBC_01730]|uniref:RNB domain-containing ribonuclease n=1 Tax=Nocardia sp. NBC_01730 TaxID=2975998 RepID=UPI002E0E9F32|nr:RNB domain-containing ribonuclease [Nocardia sp. NBC_01730]